MSPHDVWDEYALRVKPRPPANAAGDTTWFNWTQYPDHGPGAEVLGIGAGADVLDLGCGKGDNLAHLASLGARSVGVDVSAFQLADAYRWGDALELHPTDALSYLAKGTRRFDAVFSVFGAVWFTDPALLLPAVRGRLRPGGVLAFSQFPPGGRFSDEAERAGKVTVPRWDYEPDTWLRMLRLHGYVAASAEVLPAPTSSRDTGTMLVRAVG
ncbi:class I SAM-dependent methyltransferase [Streptomyces chryseus]